VSAWTAVPHRKSWDCWVTLTSAPETVALSGILDDHFEVAGAMLLDAFVRGLGRVRRRPAAGDDAAPPSPVAAAAAPTFFM